MLVVMLALSGADARKIGPGSWGELAATRNMPAMPAGLRAAYLATVQAEAGAGYAVKPGKDGLSATNPAQGIVMEFSAEGFGKREQRQ